MLFRSTPRLLLLRTCACRASLDTSNVPPKYSLQVVVTNMEKKLKGGIQELKSISVNLNKKGSSPDELKERIFKEYIALLVGNPFVFFSAGQILQEEPLTKTIFSEVVSLSQNKRMVKASMLIDIYMFMMISKNYEIQSQVEELFKKMQSNLNPEDYVELLWLSLLDDWKPESLVQSFLAKVKSLNYIFDTVENRRNIALKIKATQIKYHYEKLLPQDFFKQGELIIPDENDFFSHKDAKHVFEGIYKINLKEGCLIELSNKESANRNLLIYKAIKQRFLLSKYSILHYID